MSFLKGILLLMICGSILANELEMADLPFLIDENTSTPDVAALEDEFPESSAVILDRTKRIFLEKGLFSYSPVTHIQIHEAIVVLDPSDSEILEYRYKKIPTSLKLRVKHPNGEFNEFTKDDFTHRQTSLKIKSTGGLVTDLTSNIVSTALTPIAAAFSKLGLKNNAGMKHKDWVFTVPGVVKGTIIELSTISNEGKKSFYVEPGQYCSSGTNEFFLLRHFPMIHSRTELIVPGTLNAEKKKYDTIVTSPYLEAIESQYADNYLSYVWELNAAPALSNEAYSIDRYKEAITIRAGNSVMWGYGLKGATGNSYRRSQVVSQMGKNKINNYERALSKIPMSGDSELEKLSSIVYWVQDNMEVVYSTTEDKLKKMLKQRKAPASWTVAIAVMLCKAAGLDVELAYTTEILPEIVEDGLVGYADDRAPILVATIDGKKHYGFPQYDGLNIDCVPSVYIGKLARSAVKPKIFKRVENESYLIQAGPAENSKYTHDIGITLVEDAEIEFSESFELNGLDAWRIRNFLNPKKDYSKKKKKKKKEVEDPALVEKRIIEELKTLVSHTGSEILEFAYTVENKEDWRKPLVLTVSYRVENDISYMPGEILYNVQGLFAPRSGAKSFIDTEDRINPIIVKEEEWVVKNVTLNFPAAWELDKSPFIDFNRENEFGSLKAKHEFATGSFKLFQEQIIHVIERSAEEYDEFLKVKLRGSSMDIPAITFITE
jgi:hypothetical protein